MWSTADFTLLMLTTLVEAFVVYLFVVQGLFRQFLFLNLYLLLSVTSSVGGYAILSRPGPDSLQCYYFYLFTDVLSETFLFFSICQLSARLAGDKMPHRKVVLLGLGGFIATAWISFSAASSWPVRGATLFAADLSQNIFFVCCLVIVGLWAWKLRNKPNDSMANRLLTVLSVYFLLFLLASGANQMAPRVAGTISVFWIAYAWLPIGSGFALVACEQR